MARKHGVLLVNLGSPDSTSVKDVRRYLREFLSDPRVLDSNPLVRWLVLNLFILPSRPQKSAEAYKTVWQDEGSPLLIGSRQLRELVAEEVDITVELAMRYGNPPIEQVIKKLKRQAVERLFVIPLYPHYAMSSYETVVVKVNEMVKKHAPHMEVRTMQPFYNNPQYIDALVESAQPYLSKPYDMLLFSFHGIPVRHLCKGDASKAHCTKVPDCCNVPSPAHAMCYRHQCMETVKAFIKKANITEDKYFTSFQSRLGRDPWLEPYTDKTLEALPEKGVKNLLVICPAFVNDCLETLEEIAEEGKEEFLEAGGESFFQIPCLNDHPAWVRFLVDNIKNAWS